MKKIFLIPFFIFIAAFVYADSINLSTYYPAPSGVYKQLRLYPSATLTGSCDIGSFYVENPDTFRFCRDDGNGTGTGAWSLLGGTWSQSGDNIYPTDTLINPDLKVGIGTTTPSMPLTVFEGGILSEGFDASSTLGVSGEGSRFFWYPKAHALRGGYVSGDHWDEANLGYASFSIGENTRATGYYSMAMGSQTQALSTNAVALGKDSKAGTTGNVAATAMGWATEATGESSTAMNWNTLASGIASTAMGHKSVASGHSSFAVGAGDPNINGPGSGPNATGDYSVAMGWETLASGNKSFAVGDEARATNASSYSIGSQTLASGSISAAIGYNAVASGNRSFAFGEFTQAISDDSMVLGGFSRATGSNSIAIGFGQAGNRTEATNTRAVAIGSYSVASGPFSLAVGQSAVASNTNSVAIGFSTDASGPAAVAIGNNNTSSGDFTSVAIGYENVASGDSSISMGRFTQATADHAVALGFNTKASGFAANAIGQAIEARGNNSFAVALSDQAGTIVSDPNTMAIMGGEVGIGTVTPTSALHVVGNIYATGSITPGSSRELKENIESLSLREARDTLAKLDPIKFIYKADGQKDLHVGFIAEDVPDLLATPDRKGINTMDVVAMLTKIVQDQQKQIDQQRNLIETQQKELEGLKQKINKF